MPRIASGMPIFCALFELLQLLHGFKRAPSARPSDRLRPVSWRMRGTYTESVNERGVCCGASGRWGLLPQVGGQPGAFSCAIAHRRVARGQSHGLGLGNGSIIYYGGIIEYRQTGKLLPAFKVNIAGATGFSVRKATRQDRKNGASALQQMFVLQGSGTELAACPVNNGTAQKIEA